MPATREGEPGERRELLGVGRAVAPLDDGGESRLQGDQSARRGRPACDAVRIGSGGGGPASTRASASRAARRSPASISALPRKRYAAENARVEADGLAELGDGLVEAAGRLQGVGERLVDDRQLREPAGRLPLLLDRGGPVAPVRVAPGRSGRGPSSRPASAASPRRIRRRPRAAPRARGVPTRARRGRGHRRAGAASPRGRCRRPPRAGRSGGAPSRGRSGPGRSGAGRPRRRRRTGPPPRRRPVAISSRRGRR